MKIFDYECERCNFLLEDVYVHDENELHNCTICHKPMKRLPAIVRFVLKGDCWAKDRYTKKKEDNNGTESD